MINWLIVIGLLVSGLGLIWTEIIFVAGTFIVGVLGLVSCLVGIGLTYYFFDASTGHLVMVLFVISMVATFYYILNRKTWSRFMLHDTLKAQVNDAKIVDVNIGDLGMSTSTLRPVGKGAFNGKYYEVTSIDHYIPRDIQIIIVKLEGHRIFVRANKSN